MTDAVVRCEWCTTPAAAGATGCAACGGPVALLEPWVLECGWCGRSNRRDETASCLGCGGPLPTIPGSHPGPRPPEVPRALPSGYRWRVLLFKNVLAFIGAVFTIPFCWSGFGPVVGIPLWVHGHRRARRWLDALEFGVATGGEIVSVEKDRTQSINQEHPWRIEFEYETPGGRLKGHVEAWDPAHARRVIGEHVWVVYTPAEPASHALWPPVH